MNYELCKTFMLLLQSSKESDAGLRAAFNVSAIY